MTSDANYIIRISIFLQCNFNEIFSVKLFFSFSFKNFINEVFRGLKLAKDPIKVMMKHFLKEF
jgi:hypothetical protein